MPITDTQYKRLILQEVGKVDDTNFPPLLEVLWSLYEPFGNIAVMVQFAYVKRHAILLAMGDVVADYDTQELNIVRKESQKFTNYERLLKVNDGLITWAESYYNYDGAYLIGQIKKQTPIEYDDVLWSPNQLWTSGLATWMTPL